MKLLNTRRQQSSLSKSLWKPQIPFRFFFLIDTMYFYDVWPKNFAFEYKTIAHIWRKLLLERWKVKVAFRASCWCGPGEGLVARSCECGNEPSGFIQCGDFSTSWGTVSFSRKALLDGSGRSFGALTGWSVGRMVTHFVSWLYSRLPVNGC